MNQEPDQQVLLRSATLISGVFLIGSAVSSLFVIRIIGLPALYTPAAIQILIGSAAVVSWFAGTSAAIRKKILFAIAFTAMMNAAFAIALFFRNVESLRKPPKSSPTEVSVNSHTSPIVLFRPRRQRVPQT